MQAYSVETVVTQDGKIQLDELPFLAGETVQIIILPGPRPVKKYEYASLKDSVVKYTAPLEPVASEDWDAVE